VTENPPSYKEKRPPETQNVIRRFGSNRTGVARICARELKKKKRRTFVKGEPKLFREKDQGQVPSWAGVSPQGGRKKRKGLRRRKGSAIPGIERKHGSFLCVVWGDPAGAAKSSIWEKKRNSVMEASMMKEGGN